MSDQDEDKKILNDDPNQSGSENQSKIEEKNQPEDVQNLDNEKIQSEIENINQNDLLPFVLKFIKTKSKENYMLAVGSSSRNANFILKKTRIHQYFKCIIDGNMVKNPKPDPEVFLNASLYKQMDFY